MPKSDAFDRRADVPIGRVLELAAFDRLPSQLTSDESFVWLRGLLPESTRVTDAAEPLGISDIPQLMLKSLRDHSRDEASQKLARAAGAVATSLLSRTLQYYLDTALAIGHRWHAATVREGWARRAAEPENIDRTLRANTADAPGEQIGDAKIGLGRADVLEIVSAAQSFAGAEQKLCRDAWSTWTSEVIHIRTILKDHQVRLDEPLGPGNGDSRESLHQAVLLVAELAAARGGSQVAVMMGAPVASGEAAPSDPELLMLSLAIQFATASTKEDLWWHSYHRFEETLYRAQSVAHGLRYAERAKRKEERLETKYGDTNPFDAYRPLGRPADAAMFELLSEHEIPGGGQSDYTNKWKQTLSTGYWSRYDQLNLELADENEVERAAAAVDAEIKRMALYNYDRFPRAFESLDEFNGRRWNDWVDNAIKSAKKGTTKDQLFSFITAVHKRLLKLGYRLPPRDRS